MLKFSFFFFAVVGGVVILTGASCGDMPSPSTDGGIPPQEMTSSRVIAIAGPDLEVLEGQRVRLSAFSSRALGNPASLVWSQIDGPAVLISDPTSPGPLFVAPLAPTTLRFRVRVTDLKESAFDDVVVRVRESGMRPPILLDAPGDVVATAGSEFRFPVGVISGDLSQLTFAAELTCADEQTTPIDVIGGEVAGTLGATLPCIIRIHAVTADGRRSGRIARAFHNDGTLTGPETVAIAPIVVAPQTAIEVRPAAADGRDVKTIVSVVDGNAFLDTGAAGFRPEIISPKNSGPVHFTVEYRRDGFSGGVRAFIVDVSAGDANRSPTVVPGPDRTTTPGGHFGITVFANDVDGDSLTTTITQVLGATAERDPIVPHLFTAPSEPGTLLFHVVASDGVVDSAPDTVRVIVDNGVINVPPVIDIAPVRFVSAASPFTIDASGATDPDSGFIASITIAQDASDPVIVLDAPIVATTLTLTSGNNGDVYHFRVTAADDAGATTTVTVTVTVETAGPYVDAARGSDASGDGTVDNPFASLAAMLPVATRHNMPEVRLAGGSQLSFGADLAIDRPIVGGFVFQGGTYVMGSTRSDLPIGPDGLAVNNGGLRFMNLTLPLGDAPVTVEGASSLSDVTIQSGVAHGGNVVVIRSGATVGIDNALVKGGPESEGAAILVESSSSLRLINVDVVAGGAGPSTAGVACHDSQLDVISSTVHGGAGTESVGILADDCDMAFLSSTITGGDGETAAGIRAHDSSLFTSPSNTVVGAGAAATEAVGISLTGTQGSVHLEGVVWSSSEGASVDIACGVNVEQPRVEIVNAQIDIFGNVKAVGVSAKRHRIRVLESNIAVNATEATGIELFVADDLYVADTTISATADVAYGIHRPNGDLILRPRIERTSVVSTGELARGIDMADTTVASIEDIAITVDSTLPAPDANGLLFGQGIARDIVVSVAASGDPVGVLSVGFGGDVVIERGIVHVESIDGGPIGLRVGASTNVRSVCINVNGPGIARGISLASGLRATHVTIQSSAIGVRIEVDGQIERLANSAIVGAAAISADVDALASTLIQGNAFDTDFALITDDDTLTISRGQSLAALPGNVSPNSFATLAGGFAPSGHLMQPDPDVIDRAVPELSIPFDVDDDVRPFGDGPDIGCDEFTGL